WTSNCITKGVPDLIQLALACGSYAEMLQKALRNDLAFHDWQVKQVDTPDPSRDGVIVMDAESLERLRSPLRNPERVVLVTRKSPELLNQAWDAGIVSVVGDTDPLSTAMLAILAARFRARKAA
ncbi:MAG TPA: hypothetical protein VEU62_19595, partial [Bryobacterales bacterium]|nr:hypothetical protein [Bryobacterales bacterium]